MRVVAVRHDHQRVRLCQALQRLGDTGVRAPGGDALVHRPRVALAVLQAEPAHGALHGPGDDLVERLVLAHALVDPVRLAGLQELVGDLGRQPVAQDLTDRVVDAELDQRSVHVERHELRLDVESHESSWCSGQSRPCSALVDCRPYVYCGRLSTMYGRRPRLHCPVLGSRPAGLPSPCEEHEMKFTSYWLDTAPQGSPERSQTTVEGRTDVAVVGGGLTGVVAALHLARRGAKVELFEQHTVGFGASGRNGGMATTGMSIGIRDAVAKLGFDTAAAAVPHLRRGDRPDREAGDGGGHRLRLRTPRQAEPRFEAGALPGFREDPRAVDHAPGSGDPAGPEGRAASRDRVATFSTAEWSTRRAPVSTSASTSGDSARPPSARA